MTIPKFVRPSAVGAGAALMVVFLTAVACDDQPKPAASQQTQQKITEQYARNLTSAVPYPLAQMKDSIERRNLRERLLRYNDPDKISYIYLLSQTGQVITYYTIKGKVSNNSSQMTNSQNVNDCTAWRNPCRTVTDSMGDDGSYGPNEAGVFFFTTEDVMVTWNGSYLLSDAPQEIKTPPVIIYDKSSRPTSTGGHR
jgi:hypothetical protein